MNNEQDVEGLNVSHAIAKPMLAEVTLKCKLGFHNYEQETIQRAKGVVDSFSMNPIIRLVKVCKCGNKRITPLNIASTKLCFDESLTWQ